MSSIIFNDIDNRWKVLSDKGYIIADGETREEALDSAKELGVIL